MTPIQRKVLLALADYWRNWANSPSLDELAAQLAMCDTSVRIELYEMEKWGFVEFIPKQQITDKFAVRPSKKAEQWMGRIRELA